jgi:dihydrofolate synthase / folylpolyglutamate synthase
MGRFPDAASVFASFEPYIDLERGAAREPMKLDRMRALCAAAGDPQLGCKFIHVAGSKGKGSVAAMLASILSAAGVKAGLYASPHVRDYRDRISLSGTIFPDSSYTAAGEECHAARERYAALNGSSAPTFFELLTLLGFIVFARERCPWVVLETGLGGRLDSTNVVVPEASVITPIELEHVEYLGDTIPAIAGEKAGIIKEGRPVFISRMRPEAVQVMRERAASLGCAFHDSSLLTRIIRAVPGLDGTDVEILVSGAEGGEFQLSARLPMCGRIQAENAALAALVSSRLIPGLAARKIESGLEGAALPARFEILSRQPLIVADGSHTPDSVTWALDTWLSLRGKGGTLLFGCASDKDASAMARVLSSSFDHIVITKPGSFKRSEPLAVFRSFEPAAASILLEADTEAAIDLALAYGDDVLVAGSFYLAAIARERVLKSS